MSSRPFVKASGNNILDISGQLNIKSYLTDNSGIRFYGSERRIVGQLQNYSNNYIGLTADASGENIMYHLPYDDNGNTINDISDCRIIATQCYVRENATKPVNNRGQTFFEIMTEQPQKFTFKGSSNSGNVTIKWHYDDIIPNSDFPCNLLLAAKKSTIKDKQLPYIDKIYIDISGSVDDVPSGQSGSTSGDTNKWLRHAVIDISDNGYNQNEKTFIFNKTSLSSIYQTSILNILGKDTSSNSFDVRIYGENFADKENDNCPFPNASDNSTFNNEYSRALVIPGLFFPGAKPPSKPQRYPESVTYDSINLSFYVSYTEDGVFNSNALVIKSKAEYVGIETLSSILHLISTSTLNTGDVNQPGVGGGISSPFDVTLSGIKSGSKYRYKVAAMNDLINQYSEFSEDISSNFTKLPSSTAQSAALDFSYKKTKYVTNKSFKNQNIIYINKADNQDIIPNVTSNQNFEITKRNALVTDDTHEGFGKYVDGSKNLVTITMKINDVSINEIQYHGFGSTGATDLSFNNSSSSLNEKNYYMIYSQDDIGDNSNNKGFRINGNIKLQTISNSNVQNYIGDPSKNPIILKYEYSRKSAVDNSPLSDNSSNKIYIDDLSKNPTIDSSSTIINVTNVAYLMGIPSVRTFSVTFDITYANINSAYEYIPGDRKIARIEQIQNTSFPQHDVKIEKENISANGLYTKDLSFNNVKYTSSTISNGLINQNFTIQEKIYSLKGTTSISNDISVNHYCDLNSFIVNSLVFYPKINYNKEKLIYEIRDISGLSNIKDIILDAYKQAHTDKIKDHTLLYFDGAFRSNGNKPYPDVNDFSYNPIVVSDKYDSGSYAYDLLGNQNDGGGYKWIGFKAAFIAGSDKSTSWTSGKASNFDASGSYIKKEGSVFYFDFQELLSLYGFHSTSIDILTSDSSNIIGFIKQINVKPDNSFLTCIGNISMNINPSTPWMYEDVEATLDSTLNGVIKSKHGCLKTLSNGKKVIQLSEDLAAKGSGIDLFIGFKNFVSVSSNNT